MKNMFLKNMLFLFFLLSVFVQGKKYAVIIAVGDYQLDTGWSKISSINDVPLIKSPLLMQGFLEEDITVLADEGATKAKIITALESLKTKIKPGDIVMIHYSGHGQQIFDDNSDEADGLDEALIPYDAWAKYNAKYKGENHIRDDELNTFTTSIRNNLGKTGQLLVILDSCHSGSTTRGQKARGGVAALTPPDWKADGDEKTSGSGLLERAVLRNDASPMIMISGASAEELNYEYDGVGSLSYAFSKAMNELGSNFTYRQLFSRIASNMNVIAPKQRPTIEGDIDYKLFKGDYVSQQPYFDITKLANSNTILTINGGQINRIFNNTTILVMPAGTVTADAAKALARGKVTATKMNTAVITLDSALKDANPGNYWVFVDQPSFGDIAVNVFFHETVTDEDVKKSVADYLTKNSLGRIVSSINESDILIEKAENKFKLNYTKGDGIFNVSERARGDESAEINSKIFTFAQGNYLKTLSLKESDYEFDFKLVPIEYNPSTGVAGALKIEKENLAADGVFFVKPNKDYAVLEISNKSKRPLYISVVEINTPGEIHPFFPSSGCTLNDQERKIAPGKTVVFRDCVYAFGPPYERLILKGFASDKPLNFQSTVISRGEGSAGTNPLESFLQGTYNNSRGGTGSSATGKMEGYSAEFVYDIVK